MINAGTVYSALVLDSSKYEQGMKQAQKNMDEFGKKMEDAGKRAEAGFGSKMTKIGDGATKIGKDLTKKVTLPIAGMGAAVLKTGMQFEAKMSEVQAISGATGDQLKQLENKAKEMGETTKFSASQSADALKYMAMAGWETEQMLSGIDGVMMLAAASGEDLALVSDIVTDALTAFGMEAEQATQFADLLAKTSMSANTNVALMGETFKYVAPIFGSLGYSAEDAALATGLMANAGIKGSQAGTVLRAAITGLTNPTGKAAELIKELKINLTDAEGRMLPFSDVMGQLREKFSGLTEQQQAQYAATIFGQQAMSGMLTIIGASEEDFNKLTDATRNYSGAAKEAADIMQDNLSGRLTQLMSKIEGVAIKLYDLLIPHAEKLIATVSKWVDWFSKLDTGTQETIVKLAGLAVAMGPVLLIGGKMASGIGNILNLFGKLTSAAQAATAATTAMGGGFNIAGLAAKAGALLLNPWTLAIAAATVGGIALYKHLSQEAIPAVDLFGDEVSESTQKAVGGFLELHDEADRALKQLYWSSADVTEEMAETISGNFAKMGEQIRAGLAKDFDESKETMKNFFQESKNISVEEQQKILEGMDKSYEKRRQTIEEGETRIKEILDNASQEKRGLHRTEKAEIEKIQKEMAEAGIRVLSESEKEQQIIRTRMERNATELSARQAAEVVKNSKEQADKTIQEAERQRDEVIAEIKYQQKELGTITEEQAEKLIAEAERQCDETVKNAERMHNDVVKFAKEQAKEHIHEVDWESGEIKTKWQAMVSNVSKKAREMKDNVINRYKELKTGAIKLISEKKEAIIEKWTELKDDAYKWAGRMMEQFKEGITDKIEAVKTAASNVGSAIAKVLRLRSPAEEGPLSDSDKWMPNFMQMLADGINKNFDKVKKASDGVAQKIGDSLSKVNNYVTNTVGVIDKQFQLWVLHNNAVKDSAEYLSKQLEAQKQKHEILNEQIKATELALAKVIEKYGEGSGYALEYENKLLSLKVAQAELKKSIDATTGAMKRQISVYDSPKSVVTKYMADYIKRTGDISVAFNAKGTNYWRGGLTWVGEEGPELVELPRGSKIYSTLESLKLAMAAASSLDTKLFEGTSKQTASTQQPSKSGDIYQRIVINSPSPLTPSEIARKNLQASRQLAMEWGL